MNRFLHLLTTITPHKEPKALTPKLEPVMLEEFMEMTEINKDHKASCRKGAAHHQADFLEAPQAASPQPHTPPKDSLRKSSEADDLDDILEKEWLKRLAIPFEENIESDQEEPHLQQESEPGESVDIFGVARPVSQMILEPETEEEPQLTSSVDFRDTFAEDCDVSSANVRANYKSGTSAGGLHSSASEVDGREASSEELAIDSHETPAGGFHSSASEVRANYKSGTSAGGLHSSASEVDGREASIDGLVSDSHETSAKESDQDGGSCPISATALVDCQDPEMTHELAGVPQARLASPLGIGLFLRIAVRAMKLGPGMFLPGG